MELGCTRHHEQLYIFARTTPREGSSTSDPVHPRRALNCKLPLQPPIAGRLRRRTHTIRAIKDVLSLQ
ncbi:hypothetical protein C8Q79DRAFT_935700 [Trametes meyenii]|nr:hypothetical protein C8Q79DRAFT_935700 [Trametes meyenii]